MLHRLWKRLGFVNSIIVATATSMLVSVLITVLISLTTSGRVYDTAILVALLVPALVAPVFSSLQLRLIAQLDNARDEMRHLAITDELTQAYSRRFFFEELERAWSAIPNGAASFAILLIDVDDFKAINDTYGHTVGDRALIHLSDTCRRDLRRGDLFARYGGEEFVLLLPATSAEEAFHVAERLCARLADTPLIIEPAEICMTVSIGIAVSTPATPNVDALISVADVALYNAKRNGKNCIVIG